MKPIRNSGRDRAGQRTAKLGELGMAGAALPVVAGTALQVEALAGYMPVFLILFIVMAAVTLAGWKSFSMNKKLAAGGVTALFFALLVAPFMGGIGPVTPPGPPGKFVPAWEILIPGTIQGTPRDTMAEIFDTQGGTGGGGQSPTATLCAFGTNAEADRNGKNIRVAISVDDDAATSGATFSAPDSCSFDLAYRLTNPQDANGDGTMDSVSIFGRVRSLTASVTQDGNETAPRNILMFDNTFGWYVGWGRDVDAQTTDGAWISAAAAGVSDARYPSESKWDNLGANAGADEDYIAFAYIARNYGWYGYTQPPIGFVYTFTLDIGTPESFVTYTVVIFLSVRD